VPIEDGLRDPRLGRNLVHRHARPARLDNPVGDVQEFVVAPLSLARALSVSPA
jgi:hypothetical protein